MFVAGFSSILTGLNFIVTIHTMRAPGMTGSACRCSCGRIYATSLIMVLAHAGARDHAAAASRSSACCGIGIFDPALGGDPLLFQHLFWFYSHPAVYIMVLPAMGVVSEIVACFARKPHLRLPLRSPSRAWRSRCIGFLVWGHHMFVSGQSIYAGMVFSFLSFLVAIPSAIKVFNWTATLYKGSITL